MADIAGDGRLDPRVRDALLAVPSVQLPDVADRDELLRQVNHPKAAALREATEEFHRMLDTEEIATFEGLRITEHEYTSAPDGNIVRVKVTRPDTDEVLPCLYYIHGGGMQSGSAFAGRFPALARIIAAEGAVVVMVDFRNCLIESTATRVEPFPAGLNDCVSGIEWVVAMAGELGIDPDRIVLTGESGGGNLAIATGMRLLSDGGIDLVSGIYALCPFIAGEWPQERYPSSSEFNGYYLSLHSNRSRIAYGIEAFEAGDPLAWPSFATVDDVAGLPPTVISVNECDPLRDEGVEFYRLLLAAGVRARCRIVMGTAHAMDLYAPVLPDVTRETAASMAHFARTTTRGGSR
jgi:acetyl esterase/lipase